MNESHESHESQYLHLCSFLILQYNTWPEPLSSLLCAGVCDGGELPQGTHHWTGQDGNTSEVLQSETGRGPDQEPAAQRAGPLGEAGAAVCRARPSAGRRQEESQTGTVLCILKWALFHCFLLSLESSGNIILSLFHCLHPITVFSLVWPLFCSLGLIIWTFNRTQP